MRHVLNLFTFLDGAAMGRATNKLSDSFLRTAKHSGKTQRADTHSDGGGLYFLVSTAGGKSWQFNYTFAGKQKTLRLGAYPALSAAQARKAKEEAKTLLVQGIDPNINRQALKLQQAAEQENSFQHIALQWLDKWKAGKATTSIRNASNTLQRDIFPAIGALPITSVTPPMITSIMQRINERGAGELARRARVTCGQIFRFAISGGYCTYNPAASIAPADILPERQTRHQPRISAKELPSLLQAIQAYDGRDLTRYALQLLALTFVRTGELIGAQWAEFDFTAARWDIPAERMKIKTPHIVPLSRQAIELLRQIHDLTGSSQWVFPHDNNPRKCMSNNTMLYALYRMGYRGRMTGHGFRGVASTILHERGFNHAHIELQLAHMERDAISAAYNHATYLQQRAMMMQQWADYLDALKDGKPESRILHLPPKTA